MNKIELIDIISECCNDILFEYNGKSSGITSEVKDSIPVFQVWHGNDIKYYTKINELLEDDFYSGKSINDLIGIVDFTFA